MSEDRHRHNTPPAWAAQFAAQDRDNPKSLYRFFSDSQFERIWDTLAANRIYLSLPSTFNDAFDGRAEVRLGDDQSIRAALASVVNRNEPVSGSPASDVGLFKSAVLRAADAVQDRYRVCCFSSAIGSALLWAHYANGHRGVAIEFDYSKLRNDVLAIQPVCYRPSGFAWEYPKQDFDELYLSQLTKSSEWEYECEYRLVRLAHEGEWADIPADCISGVYFGMRAPALFVDWVSRLILNHRRPLLRNHVDLYVARGVGSGQKVAFDRRR